MKKVYKGELECKYFAITVERFIVREDSVSFSFSGIDVGYGEFKVDGKAELQEDCSYKAPLELNYVDSEEKDPASISIEIEANETCKVEMTWTQDNETYKLTGDLEKWKQDTTI